MTDLNTNEPINLLVVPNGTEVLIFEGLVERYRVFARKSAENIIKLGETLLEAKQKLSDQRLKDFCHEVRLEHDGSTFRKLLKIGEEASRFEPFVDLMPNSWTTVYKLAKLEKDKFDIVAHDVRFSPLMTAAEVDQVVSGQPDQEGDGLSRDLTIDLSGFDVPKKLQVFEQCKQLEQEFGFQLRPSKPFQKLLKPGKTPASSLRGLMGQDGDSE